MQPSRKDAAHSDTVLRPRYLTVLAVKTAAEQLSTTESALRARCRRNATRDGDKVVADLGGGIVAFKFGRSWRVAFPASFRE